MSENLDLATLTAVCRPEIFSRTLESGVAALFFDGRADGVVLPAQLQGQSQVILNFSWRYNVADFTFDGTDARASLSFGGVPSHCVVPWHAVWGISDDQRTDAWFWIASMPVAIQRSFGVSALGELAASLVAHQKGATMEWHRLGDDGAWSAAPIAAPAPAPRPQARPAWLRVVGDTAEASAPDSATLTTEGTDATAAPQTEPPPEPPPGPRTTPPPTGRPMLRRIK